MSKPKNSIKTPSYFCKRLRDNGFIVLKIFQGYGQGDSRRWTVLVDPGYSSVFITCYTNKDFAGDIMFEFNDGGVLFPKNWSIKTESIEVIITRLIEKGINNNSESSPYYSSPKYLGNGQEQQTQA
jgi:hypothetical protein